VAGWTNKVITATMTNATQATAANQPTFTTNASLLPGLTGLGRVLRFTNTLSTRLNVDLKFLTSKPYTILIVEGRSSNKGEQLGSGQGITCSAMALTAPVTTHCTLATRPTPLSARAMVR